MKSITCETTLRLALFTSLGLLPLACGGTTQGTPNESSGGSSSQGGSAAKGGSTANAGSTAKGGSGNVGGASQKACTSPVTDPLTGLVSCAEGYSHRPIAKQCGVDANIIAPPGSGVPAPLPRADGSVECSAETADNCAAYQFGYCRMASQGGGPFLPTCQSGCVSDSDCGANQACLCNDAESPTGGSCQYVSCRTDADCPGGNLCASAGQTCGGGTFACQTAQDKCASNADCGQGVPCIYGETGDDMPRRQCGSGVVCGRPFLVEHAPRLAAVVAGGAWAGSTDESARPRLERLTPAERAAQAEHWSYLGQMEHASIAAFARFSLQLLALGAPPELVSACTQALADETAHTQLCFRLASAYAGRTLGPGPLDVQHSLEQSSLSDVVELVIAEGCFGETRAALEALEAADGAEDPVIRAAYARIAADEERHAELAFRFVRWALAQGDDAVRARIQVALATAPADRAAQQISVPCLAALT